MPINVICDSCDRAWKLKDECRGQLLPCPGCGRQLAVPLHRFTDGNEFGSPAVSISPDGSRVIRMSEKGLITTWDVKTQKRVAKHGVCEDEDPTIPVAAFAPDGRTVLTGEAPPRVSLWDAA